ncbi:hypothetical protein B0J14DRAFT_100712 [Halenospora varia]|nr:hypothetical protein B0J14DRAFT_100712 [Halenospora varia]
MGIGRLIIVEKSNSCWLVEEIIIAVLCIIVTIPCKLEAQLQPKSPWNSRSASFLATDPGSPPGPGLARFSLTPIQSVFHPQANLDTTSLLSPPSPSPFVPFTPDILIRVEYLPEFHPTRTHHLEGLALTSPAPSPLLALPPFHCPDTWIS